MCEFHYAFPSVAEEVHVIVAMDVHYDDDQQIAWGALIGFETWAATEPVFQKRLCLQSINKYRPGAFYQRELHVLLALLEGLSQIDVILVDGYACLPNGHALGQVLSRALRDKIPIIGVAKNPFVSANAPSLCRGESRRPLYVTAIGMDEQEAIGHIKSMAGNYRLPTLLTYVDHLARGYVTPS